MHVVDNSILPVELMAATTSASFGGNKSDRATPAETHLVQYGLSKSWRNEMKRQDRIFRELLERRGFTLSGSEARIHAPHEPDLKVHMRLVRGLQDDSDVPRSFSILEFAVPQYRFFLTAFSQYMPSPSQWSDQFYLATLESVRGAQRTPTTLLFQEPHREREKYRPHQAEQLRNAGDQRTPWITFAIHGSEPRTAEPLDLPLFHRLDLREAVADPEKDLVMLEGDTFVRCQGLRPFGAAGDLAMFLAVFQQRLPKEARKLWGRLNSRQYKCPDTGDVWAANQKVLEWGYISGLKRQEERIGGYICVRGCFSPLEGELRSPWIPESELNTILHELYAKSTIATVIGGEVAETDGLSAIEQEEDLHIELSVESLQRFLTDVAERQARQRTREPLKPYGDLITLLHALDAQAVELAANALLAGGGVDANALLCLLPKTAELGELIELRDIVAKSDIKIDTVRRRIREYNLQLVKTKSRQSALLRKDYELHKYLFHR